MFSKPFSSRTLLSLGSSFPSSSPFPYSILVAHFSTSSPSLHSKSHSPSHSHAESRNVRVSVWWDFENCHLPTGVNVFRVAHVITSALRSSGIKGPIQITAFGDILQLSRTNQEALSFTGINLTHIPRGGKNSADRSLLIDLMYWVSQNPPPAHLFLISGDRDFASTLHRLRMNNYNILLATTDTAPNVLCSAASVMWNWNTLVRGESLTGRYFNQPPDGPYGSWYGHYKGALEDPFPAVEQPVGSRVEDLSVASLELSISPIPDAVVKQISLILSSSPKGISITDLRAELAKSKVDIDKNFYGYRKFSRFLLSMPHILKLKATGDGQYVVHSSIAKAPEPFDVYPCFSAGPVTNKGKQCLTRSSKTNEDISMSGSADEKPSVPLSRGHVEEHQRNMPLPSLRDKSVNVHMEQPPKKIEQPHERVAQMHVEQPPKKIEQPHERVARMHVEQPPKKIEQPYEKSVKVHVEQPPKNIEQPPLGGVKAVEVVYAKTENPVPPGKDQDSTSKVGFFTKICRIWFGSDQYCSEMKNDVHAKESYASGGDCDKKSENTLKKCSSSGDTSQMNEAEKNWTKSPNQNDDLLHSTSSSSSVKSALDNTTALYSEQYDEKPSKSGGLFNWVMNWCKSWRNDPRSLSSDAQTSEVLEQRDGNSRKHEIFSKESFWRDMETFINTDKGSVIISQSRTRAKMAQDLQKEGPSVLSSITENDVLHLVDMLISEKKWVQECSSDCQPFKLTCSVETASLGNSGASNGLRSIFLGSSLSSELQKPAEQNRENKFQNVSDSGASDPVTNKKPSEKARSEILGDCQKLVNEVLKEFPGGYSLTSFRKLFLQRYGYHLDIKKLGYQKLASLLQIFPGVKIESNSIVPAAQVVNHSNKDVPTILEGKSSQASANSDSELSDATKKDDESDSYWEELGPVDESVSCMKKQVSAVSKSARNRTPKSTCPDYESALSDDEFSDSEREYSPLTKVEGKMKPCEDSSLLQILDSWYNSKESDTPKGKPENVGLMVDRSSNGLQPYDSSGLGAKTDTSSGTYSAERRPQRTYSFVDPCGNNKDETVDGILGSLQRANRISKVDDSEVKTN